MLVCSQILNLFLEPVDMLHLLCFVFLLLFGFLTWWRQEKSILFISVMKQRSYRGYGFGSVRKEGILFSLWLGLFTFGEMD